MVVNEEQEFYLNELIYNTEAINDIIEDMAFNEISDNGNSSDNQNCRSLLYDLLKEESEILNEYVFTKDFVKTLKFYMEEGLTDCSISEQRISRRIIKLLTHKLFSQEDYTYSNDIYLVALNLIEEFIKNLKNCSLKDALINFKYDIALFRPELTNIFLERDFNFEDEVYIFPESYNYIYENNVFDDDYYKMIIKFYSNDMLSIKNEDYGDVDVQVKLYFYYSMIRSAFLFLKEPLSWEFFEENFNMDNDNSYSINLLKSVIDSKKDVLKRVKFMTLNR